MAETVATASSRRRVRALLLSERIETANPGHDGVVSTVPLTYKYGRDGVVTLFRYGVAVLMCLTPREEDEVLAGLAPRLIRPLMPREEEIAEIVIGSDKEDQILPGGPIALKAMTAEHL